MDQFGSSTDLQYAALEKVHDRIRLAYDGRGGVFIMDNSEEPFSAPFEMALLGELYNNQMESYHMNDDEMDWVFRMRGFASDLAREEPKMA